MSDLKDKGLDEGKKWISKPENQEKAKSWAYKAWGWIKEKFGK